MHKHTNICAFQEQNSVSPIPGGQSNISCEIGDGPSWLVVFCSSSAVWEKLSCHLSLARNVAWVIFCSKETDWGQEWWTAESQATLLKLVWWCYCSWWQQKERVDPCCPANTVAIAIIIVLGFPSVHTKNMNFQDSGLGKAGLTVTLLFLAAY